MSRGSWLPLLGGVVCAVVLAAVVAAFLIVGSPARARMERADEERVSDLERMTAQIRGYYGNRKVLPAAKANAYPSSSEYVDPETGTKYEYRVVDKTHFELCATFQTDQSKSKNPRSYRYGSEFDEPFWRHKSGRQCFLMDAKAPKQ